MSGDVALRPGVFVTFDVECSMGGAWADEGLKPVSPRRGMMGEFGGRPLGLPLLCEILDRCGVKGTFFVEPFNDELGYPGETEPVCRFLVDRGQDVQLHVHPTHVGYGRYREGKPHTRNDDIADFPPDQQRAMLAEGADRLERWTGSRPVAFRAGNMGASEQTLKILPSAGLWIDSSYSFPFAGGQCRFPAGEPYNGAKWYGDVLEVSLSGFRQPQLPGGHAAKPVDLMGSSFEECRDAVRMICDAGADAVLILHSFSLFKVRDVQYGGAKQDRVVTRRFERFCEWLGTHAEQYPARTFSQLGRLVRQEGYAPRSAAPCVLNRPLRRLARKGVQVLNRFHWF